MFSVTVFSARTCTENDRNLAFLAGTESKHPSPKPLHTVYVRDMYRRCARYVHAAPTKSPADPSCPSARPPRPLQPSFGALRQDRRIILLLTVVHTGAIRQPYPNHTPCPAQIPTKSPAAQSPRPSPPPRSLQSSCGPLQAAGQIPMILIAPTIAQTEATPKTTHPSNLTPKKPPPAPTAHLPPHPHDMHIKYISDAYAPCIRPACHFPTKPPAPQTAPPPRSLNRHAGLGRHYRRLPPSSIAFLNLHKPDASTPQPQKKCR